MVERGEVGGRFGDEGRSRREGKREGRRGGT